MKNIFKYIDVDKIIYYNLYQDILYILLQYNIDKFDPYTSENENLYDFILLLNKDDQIAFLGNASGNYKFPKEMYENQERFLSVRECGNLLNLNKNSKRKIKRRLKKEKLLNFVYANYFEVINFFFTKLSNIEGYHNFI